MCGGWSRGNGQLSRMVVWGLAASGMCPDAVVMASWPEAVPVAAGVVGYQVVGRLARAVKAVADFCSRAGR